MKIIKMNYKDAVLNYGSCVAFRIRNSMSEKQYIMLAEKYPEGECISETLFSVTENIIPDEIEKAWVDAALSVQKTDCDAFLFVLPPDNSTGFSARTAFYAALNAQEALLNNLKIEKKVILVCNFAVYECILPKFTKKIHATETSLEKRQVNNPHMFQAMYNGHHMDDDLYYKLANNGFKSTERLTGSELLNMYTYEKDIATGPIQNMLSDYMGKQTFYNYLEKKWDGKRAKNKLLCIAIGMKLTLEETKKLLAAENHGFNDYNGMDTIVADALAKGKDLDELLKDAAEWGHLEELNRYLGWTGDKEKNKE